jgi:hypothetical protein
MRKPNFSLRKYNVSSLPTPAKREWIWSGWKLPGFAHWLLAPVYAGALYLVFWVLVVLLHFGTAIRYCVLMAVVIGFLGIPIYWVTRGPSSANPFHWYRATTGAGLTIPALAWLLLRHEHPSVSTALYYAGAALLIITPLLIAWYEAQRDPRRRNLPLVSWVVIAVFTIMVFGVCHLPESAQFGPVTMLALACIPIDLFFVVGRLEPRK